MNRFLLGRLAALTDALGVEVSFLMSEDEDSHVRLGKLVERIEKVVGELSSGAEEAADPR